MKVKIALDQCVGRKRKNRLIDLGYEVVVTANHSESDDSWMNRAFAEGALFAISGDLDIPKIIEKENYPIIWIDYPVDTPEYKEKLVEYIDKSIKHKIRLCSDIAKYSSEIFDKSSKNWFKNFFKKTGG